MSRKIRTILESAFAAAVLLGALAMASTSQARDATTDPIGAAFDAQRGWWNALECDGHPRECPGWRSGGAAGGHGGSFPASQGLTVTKAEWEADPIVRQWLARLGLDGWDAYAAAYNLPNGAPINVPNFQVVPGINPGVPMPSALGVTGAVR